MTGMSIVVSSVKPQTTLQEDWAKVDRKAKLLIRLYLADFVLLNVHEEKTIASL